MFYGSEGGSDSDIGSVGAAVPCAAIWLFVILVVGGILRAQNIEGIVPDGGDLRLQHSARRAAGGAMSAILIGLLALFPGQTQVWMRSFIVGNVLPGLPIAHALTESVYRVTRYSRERR